MAADIAHTDLMRSTMFHRHDRLSHSSIHARVTWALLCSIATLAWAAQPASAGPGGKGGKARASDRIVAVLYFDNNTGDSQYDVFQKGLADMMITDLAGVAGVTVVERDRLQALLDEIALQKTKYFDKKTAIKIGKGLGARYAVTGVIHEFKPTLRIDMRMIDIASSKVTVTASVTGRDSDIFTLEQKLVKRFVAGMQRRFSPNARPPTKAPDVDTVLDYSRAIDMADRGEFQSASISLALVAKRAPGFRLAKNRRSAYAKRLAAARALRGNVQRSLTTELGKRVEQHLSSHDINKLDRDQSKLYLAYRSLRGHYILGALTAQLSTNKSGVRVVRAGEEKRALALMEAYYLNSADLLREFATYARRHTRTFANGIRHLDTFISLPREDERLARHAGIKLKLSRSYIDVALTLARFVLLGVYYDLGGDRLTVAQPLAERDWRYKKLAYQHLRLAWARAHARSKTEDPAMADAIRVLQLHAESLFLRNRDEDGINKLQEILDRYPTARNFSRIEREIKQKLGLAHSASETKRKRYAKGLTDCGDMDLRVGVPGEMARQFRLSGYAGVDATVAAVERACQGSTLRKSYWPYLYSKAALIAGKRGDCARFERYMARYLTAGGSARDLAGYRKNYTPCQTP